MPLFFIVLIFFITIPILEIYLLLAVGGLIGFWQTLGLVILTAIVGTILLRTQGTAIVNRAKAQLERGEPPARALIEGILILIGGALLLTPGFFTDAIGFICLVPILRLPLVWWLQRHLRPVVVAPHRPQAAKNPHESVVIEGEYRREK